MNKHRLTTHELREKYLSFFEKKGHVRISSAPLVPKDDPSVLFTTAGMHPLVPYLKGQEHPSGNRLTSVQKCLRTTDIDEVGDASHATVFEMLGNWSLGDYFKGEAIRWSWEFLTSPEWLGIDPLFLAVSVFTGDEDAPRDEESARIWKDVGVPEDRIAYLGKEDNWWPTGGKSPGPQGPDTEMFYWSDRTAPPEVFDPSDKRWVEIWNNVFMQYERMKDGTYKPLSQQNVDTGMGLERVVMVLSNLSSIYEIDTFHELMEHIKRHSRNNDERMYRIVADHIKAATFILGDEHAVSPSNTDRGYVLRRLIRRAVRSARVLKVNDVTELLLEGATIIGKQYGSFYPSIHASMDRVHEELRKEVSRFESALARGLREFEKIMEDAADNTVISGASAFYLYETYGFPVELTAELAREKNRVIDMEGFNQALTEHINRSRESASGKFAGGLSDHSPETIKLHTATHLLHAALRKVLGSHVWQKGSNITRERLRFDFSHPEKLTEKQKKEIENLVNMYIQQNIPVKREIMSISEAKATGAIGLFEEKYDDQVSVYRIGDVSCELCGGPHVKQTGVLGRFRITKEEAASSGIRRVKAVLEHHTSL